MKYCIPSERPDGLEFIIHVFGNNILPMKHAVRHTWLLHRLCTSRHILARVAYIMFTEKIVDHFENLGTFIYLQAASYRIEIPPASHFGRQITKKLKAERRLTHQWIHLIVVQNNLPSGVLRLLVPSHQLPIHRAGIGMLFSFFTYSSFPNIVLHISLAVGNIKLSAWLFGLSDR